ncbi:MAG: PA domain-containing protein [Thermoanaerobaculia bacterium]
MRRVLFVSLLAVFLAIPAFAGTGKVIIVNNDSPGVGLNDPTPAQPVGGNPGTTVGQQRMNVFQAAAARWSTMLDTNVDIMVQASFAPLECSADSAVLGSAGPRTFHRDFTNAPKPGVWYPVALANKFSGTDISPALPDIVMQFNGDLDKPSCLGTQSWYYGLDGNEPGSDSDLFVVVLHELAHGLGISGATRAPAFRDGLPSVFDTHTLDVTAGLRWDQMSEEQRALSLTNTGNVVWDGASVRSYLNRYLQPTTFMAITEPSVLARNVDLGFADFGAQVTSTGLSGKLVRVTDAANTDGPSVNDGCTAFTNADAIHGNVAVVDRGGCTFAIKARNAQAAGATGVIIADRSESYSADNPPTCLPPGMTANGTGGDVTIPVISIGINDANALRAQFTANATVTVSGAVRSDSSQLAGTRDGYVRLYVPCTDNPGSSLHHWDTVASPSLLMEPYVNADLLHGVDLTQFILLDMGWSLPPKSGRRALHR